MSFKTLAKAPVFEVEDATRLARSVVVATPLIVVVRILPLVERAFDEMTEDVAVTPFMIVVSVLPERDCVKELMMFARDDEMPLTIVWNTLRDEEAVFEVMMVDVPVDPPMLEVSVLPEADRELEVVIVGAMREEMVVVARVEVPRTKRVPFEVREEEKTPVVKLGVRVVAMVLVLEKTMLFPAVRLATGLL